VEVVWVGRSVTAKDSVQGIHDVSNVDVSAVCVFEVMHMSTLVSDSPALGGWRGELPRELNAEISALFRLLTAYPFILLSFTP
jgi:hypothetical protein